VITGIGTFVLLILGLASVLALRLGWQGTDAFHERARQRIVVEPGDQTAPEDPAANGHGNK
jgi:hypothetical protein